ncbi:MAG: E3 ubiquitin-protein ligase rad18 [Peltula sp. TS41687]|nr:MAG: E3 ubiquitin-protein ligase rad18 [Peltula sp. TS41687]
MTRQNDKPMEVSDPTEWLGTALSNLAPVDSALRCQVCKDFYNTPMMTSCSHTFCSICIRRCLAVDGRCPTCRAPEQEVKLRRNWALDEVVTEFGKVRNGMLSYAKDAAAQRKVAGDDIPRPGKRKFEGDGGEQLARKTRSQTRKEAGLESGDGRTVAEIQEDFVEGKGTPLKERERLPKLNYSLFKENALRKKLNELGIRASGSKSIMEKRHTEWVNLWNANCDSLRPRSKKEVLQDLDTWERTQGTLAPSSAGPGSLLMKKDFDGAAWAASHNSDFQQLIADARRQKARPASTSGADKKDAQKFQGVELPSSGIEASDGKMAANHDKTSVTSPYFYGAAMPSSGVDSSLASDNGPLANGDSIVGQALTVDRTDPIGDNSSAEVIGTTPDDVQIQTRISQSPLSILDPSQSSLASLKPLPSPAKPRMFQEADDPIVDAGGAVSVE